MASAPTSPVRLDTEGPVAKLTLDRPAGRNSFDVATLVSMRDAVQHAVDDPDVRAVIITGTGKTFCTGADLTEMERRKEDAPRLFDELTLHYHALLQTIQRSETSFVAAVNGVAAGGGVGLALASDMVIASPQARFVLAYGNLGVSPDGGATGHLVRAVGPHRARELLLLDEGLDAQTAHAWGMVNRVVDGAELDSAAEEVARRIAGRSRHTVGEVKRLVQLAAHSATDVVLEAEREAIIRGAAGSDFQEGLAAFREKRAPRFQ